MFAYSTQIVANAWRPILELGSRGCGIPGEIDLHMIAQAGVPQCKAQGARFRNGEVEELRMAVARKIPGVGAADGEAGPCGFFQSEGISATRLTVQGNNARL